jgi:alanine racemase
MSLSRRSFLGSTAAGAAALAGGFVSLARPAQASAETGQAALQSHRNGNLPKGYDPWIEVNPLHLQANVEDVARVTDGRPVMATVKNNAYGLGLEEVGPILDRVPQVEGLAVVKVDEAFRLRDAGVRKPILLMTRATMAEARDLIRLNVRLAPYSDGDGSDLERLSRELHRPVRVHLYLDTGMSRLGMPYHRALPWIEDMANRSGIQVEGSFMGFTEDTEYDREQLARFIALGEEAQERGLPLGRLHAASSRHVTFMPESHLEMVRPGLVIFGAHVSGGREAGTIELTPALRLRARVLRVERLRPGDSVSYGRNYIAEDEIYVATIPVGHSDGYPRQAVEGVRILVGDRTYPVIGAVSASHCIIEVGSEKTVEQGDVATLMGPDHPHIHPSEISDITGRSVYDVLMHLSPDLPKRGWVEDAQ